VLHDEQSARRRSPPAAQHTHSDSRGNPANVHQLLVYWCRGAQVGQIVNLMSNDANRFPEFSIFVIRIWMVPIYLSIALAQLFQLLGPAALAGVVVLILGGVFNAQVMKQLHR
jgi:predicted membrane channel-forming protein YqfA (hemolysin III family)